jgi:1,4-alpha-glucan branching enzyme
MPGICGESFDLENLKQVLDPKRQGYATAINVVNYLSTHDRQRTLRELGDRGIFDTAAFTRAKLGAALLMTAMGIPMLWMGEEFGEHKRKSESVTQPKKIAWLLLEQEENKDLFTYYQQLIALRKQSSALQSDNIEFFHENPEDKIFAYIRWHDAGDRVVVVVNMGDRAFDNYIVSNFPTDGTWKELQGNNESLTASEEGLVINLAAYEAKILANK